jgi:hypothetical protein
VRVSWIFAFILCLMYVYVCIYMCNYLVVAAAIFWNVWWYTM